MLRRLHWLVNFQKILIPSNSIFIGSAATDGYLPSLIRKRFLKFGNVLGQSKIRILRYMLFIPLFHRMDDILKFNFVLQFNFYSFLVDIFAIFKWNIFIWSQITKHWRLKLFFACITINRKRLQADIPEFISKRFLLPFSVVDWCNQLNITAYEMLDILSWCY